MGLIVIRYGEIGLKGKNQPYFVAALRKALKDCLKKNSIEGQARVVGRRICVETDEVDRATEALRNVFGVVSLSPAVEVPADTLRPSRPRRCAWRGRRSREPAAG